MFFQKLSQIWKLKDLRNKILYILGMLVIFRLVSHIPIPGINAENLKNFFESNEILGLLNVFSGGGMQNFSIVMLGVGPYITASIIFQLLTMIVPKLEALSKEPDGHKKINQYTRYLTVPLAMLQGYGMMAILNQSPQPILENLTGLQMFLNLITITAGTVFLMWIGELISEKQIGNGISLLIFAGIVSSLPATVSQVLVTFDKTQIITMLVFAVIAVITVIGVVIITEGQRNVPVSYARRIRGMKVYGGGDTYLPLRVNQAGVIPIIFAIALVIFPSTIAQFFVNAQTAWVSSAAQFVISVFQNQLVYGVLYFLLVVGFTYFYTSVIFHPNQIADNLQKQGGFIPGIRPGKNTATYLQNTITRITLFGSLFLGLIAVLPLVLRSFSGMQSMVIGGTSLLIAVSVVIEMVKQIESQLEMRDYDGF